MSPRAPHEDRLSVSPAAPTSAGESNDFAEAVARFVLLVWNFSGPTAEVIDQITEGAVSLISPTTHAAVVTSAIPGLLRGRPLADDDVTEAVLDAENSAGEGPCRDAIGQSTQVRIADLTSDRRWPQFAVAAAAAGVQSMICTPLVLDRRSLGALSLMTTSGSFDEKAGGQAKVFAAHSAVALADAQRTESLTAALSSRDVIGQAKGILMERFRLTPEAAFAVLVRTSKDGNIKLRAVAEHLCQQGFLPPTATRASRAAQSTTPVEGGRPSILR